MSINKPNLNDFKIVQLDTSIDASPKINSKTFSNFVKGANSHFRNQEKSSVAVGMTSPSPGVEKSLQDILNQTNLQKYMKRHNQISIN